MKDCNRISHNLEKNPKKLQKLSVEKASERIEKQIEKKLT